jgi:pimeloyl-ACP methyl ester carboxylesterase
MVESNRTIFTENGREIKIMEAGQPDGIPILVHHGLPGSRLLYHAWVEDALSRSIRLISYDRPGYGASTPQLGRNLASAANDVIAIAKALGINRLLVWGFSGGAPYALACAALLPDLVVAASALGSPAPYTAKGLDFFAGMGEDNIVEFRTALEGRDALQQFVEAQAPGLLSADPVTLTQAFRSVLSPIDAAAFTEDFAGFILSSMREGLAERRDGWVDDDIALVTPWGFDLGQIKIPVLLWHGKHDQSVPFAHGEWLARHIPNVDARLSADDGHLTLALRRISEVHTWLLARMV